MNVRSDLPVAGIPVLTGSQGELVLVSIAAEPRRLEELLDALAGLPFPLNPEIYHHAAVIRVHTDGRREAEAAVLVDFPAYAGCLPAIKEALAGHGFPEDAVWARNLLEGIHSEVESAPAPPGAPYALVFRQRHMPTAA